MHIGEQSFELATPQTRKSICLFFSQLVDASVAPAAHRQRHRRQSQTFDNLIGIEQHLMSNAHASGPSSLFTTTEIERSEDP